MRSIQLRSTCRRARFTRPHCRSSGLRFGVIAISVAKRGNFRGPMDKVQLSSYQKSMNPQLYQEFLNNKHLDKTRARVALAEFIASFDNDVEKESWTREFLKSGKLGHKIRNELYREIIFPVLVRGYEAGNAWETLQLARTINNIAGDRELRAQIDFMGELALLAEAYRIKPTEELRLEILQGELKFFAYSAHEWPAGILWDADGANLEQCQQLLDELIWVRSLDEGNIYRTTLDDYESKVREYQQRLASRS